MTVQDADEKVKLTEQQIEDAAGALFTRVQKLARSTAQKLRYKDPEELESEAMLAFTLALRGYRGLYDLNSIWQHVSIEIVTNLKNFTQKEGNHDKLKKSLR